MKLTIEGTLDQVKGALDKPTKRHRAKNGENARAKAMSLAAEQHAILRKAFELVRWKPENKKLADMILAALTGRAERTESVMDTAHQIIAERS